MVFCIEKFFWKFLQPQICNMIKITGTIDSKSFRNRIIFQIVTEVFSGSNTLKQLKCNQEIQFTVFPHIVSALE